MLTVFGWLSLATASASALNRRSSIWLPRTLGPEQLHRDRALERDLLGAIHRAHAALAELGEDAIATGDLAADHREPARLAEARVRRRLGRRASPRRTRRRTARRRGSRAAVRHSSRARPDHARRRLGQREDAYSGLGPAAQQRAPRPADRRTARPPPARRRRRPASRTNARYTRSGAPLNVMLASTSASAPGSDVIGVSGNMPSIASRAGQPVAVDAVDRRASRSTSPRRRRVSTGSSPTRRPCQSPRKSRRSLHADEASASTSVAQRTT